MGKNKVFCIVGLPGSGKTYLGNKISEKENAVLIDDISSMEYLSSLLEQNKNIVITDPHFCKSQVRNVAEMFILKHAPEAEINISKIILKNV